MIPKTLFLAATWIGWAAGASAWPLNASPRGQLVELHSCEVYAAGCVASSEATVGGRSVLRIWQFREGTHMGEELRGLNIAVLEVADHNLARRSARPGEAVVYLPENASDAQRRALWNWVIAAEPRLGEANPAKKVAAITFRHRGDRIRISVGATIALETDSLAACPLDSCGGELWYTPRSRNTGFRVLANRRSEVRESELQLKWHDHGSRSVFLARFDDASESSSSGE